MGFFSKTKKCMINGIGNSSEECKFLKDYYTKCKAQLKHKPIINKNKNNRHKQLNKIVNTTVYDSLKVGNKMKTQSQ